MNAGGRGRFFAQGGASRRDVEAQGRVARGPGTGDHRRMATAKKPRVAYVALLRGINVGGSNVIKMDALRRTFESLGLAAVRTLIASGNVVFRTDGTDSRKLEGTLERALVRAHGYDGKVVVRSLAEYEKMIRGMPPRWGEEKERRYYVLFLRHEVDRPSLLRELDVNEAVEDVDYVPGALLWSARLDGLTRSRMARMNTRPIYGELTVRNLNTTRRILELLKADS